MSVSLSTIFHILFFTCFISKLLLAQNTWPQPFNSEFSQSSSYFKCIPKSLIEGQYLTSSYVLTALDCQLMCTHNQGCLSFNFGLEKNDDGLHICELFDITKHGASGLTETELFDFYTVLSVPRSCSHAKSLGFNDSRIYTINPDRSGIANTFQVFCDMRDKGGVGVTVVSHDSEDRTLVSGCEPKGCYRRDVHYDGISDVTAQLGALARISAHCEQYIKYECYGSMRGAAWLVSRDGRRLNYWGGAPPNSGKCACGVAGNCAGGRGCNCDINAMRWEEDSGFLSHKDDLPITMLRFGDVTTKSGEKGYHTLGKLRCYGQI